MQVQRARQQRVVQVRLAAGHRVLVAPEVGQPVGDEVVERAARIVRRDRMIEHARIAGRIGVAPCDQIDHRARRRIGREAQRRRHARAASVRQPLAIVGVEVPTPAHGLRLVHQDPFALAQVAVIGLEQQLLAPAGMHVEALDGVEEVPVGAHLERDAQPRRRGFERGAHAVIARFGHHDPLRAHGARAALEFARERAGVRGVVERTVVHGVPARGKRVAQVAHRGEEQHQALRVLRDARGLLVDLAHQHGVAPRIEAVEARGVRIELVTEHDDEIAHRGGAHRRPPRTGARRLRARGCASWYPADVRAPR